LSFSQRLPIKWQMVWVPGVLLSFKHWSFCYGWYLISQPLFTIGTLSFYPAQFAFLYTSGLCSTYYYDGAKQANERDRAQAQADYETNIEAKKEIEALQIRLNSIEVDKLDKIIKMLDELQKQ
jgi:hypothetical protein